MVSRHTDLALTDEDAQQWSPEQQAEKQRQILKLAAAAPQRGTTRQQSPADLGLFADDQETLF